MIQHAITNKVPAIQFLFCFYCLLTPSCSFVVWRRPSSAPILRRNHADPSSRNTMRRLSRRDDIPELYRIVAEQDPEWFESFVVNLLGEEGVEDVRPSLMGTSPVMVQQESETREDLEDLLKVAQSSSSHVSVGDEMHDRLGDEMVDAQPSNEVHAASATTQVAATPNPVADDTSVQELPSALLDEPDESLENITRDTSDTEAQTGPVATQPLGENITANRLPNLDNNEGNRANTRERSTDKEVSQPTVVLWQDIIAGEWLQAPLQELSNLGYTESELVSLEPDALGFIVEEKIRKPKNGVPRAWKLNNVKASGQCVRIMTPEEADEWLASNRKTVRAAGRRRRSEPMSSAAGAEPDDPRDFRSSKQSQTDPLRSASSEEPQRRQGRENKGEPSSRERRKLRRDVDDAGQRKPIYTGRAVQRRQEIDDPPPPKAFWPDIDSFRNMLRNEAQFRLRILGDDWAKSVKEESDWRLNLYKQWLWMLHGGVGDPIIESRSERARRLASKRSNDVVPRTRRRPKRL